MCNRILTSRLFGGNSFINYTVLSELQLRIYVLILEKCSTEELVIKKLSF